VVGVYLKLNNYYQILEIEDRIYTIIEFRRIGDFNRLLNLRRVLDRADDNNLD
jgi:hypothetical protein